jgi:membrane-associated phospholipid phosphatase
MEAIWDAGVALILWLQSLGGWLIAPMRFISFFGDEEFFLLLLPMLFWSVNTSLGLRIGVMLLLSTNLNHVFKLAFHHPRPYWYNVHVLALSSETTFGLPSGHAQQSAAIWGLFAALIRRRWAWVSALILILLIGISRLYLGVHFPTDVLLGWLIGALMVWAFVRWEPAVLASIRRWSYNQQVVVAFIVSLALIGLGLLLQLYSQSQHLPITWTQNALAVGAEAPEPYSLDNIFSTAGVMFGLCGGAAWLLSRGWFSSDGTFQQRALRYLIGVAGVLLFWFVLGRVLPRGDTALAYSLRFVRYALVGVWVSGWAPALFIRLGLAQPNER